MILLESTPFQRHENVFLVFVICLEEFRDYKILQSEIG